MLVSDDFNLLMVSNAMYPLLEVNKKRRKGNVYQRDGYQTTLHALKKKDNIFSEQWKGRTVRFRLIGWNTKGQYKYAI